MDPKRRSLLKSAAMVAAGSMIASSQSAALPILAAEDDLPSSDELKWNKAPCRFCGTGCHVQVGVADGRVMAIAGDRADSGGFQ